MNTLDNLSYGEAYANLRELVKDLESDTIQLDSLAEKVKQATQLIGYCEEKLRKIDMELG